MYTFNSNYYSQGYSKKPALFEPMFIGLIQTTKLFELCYDGHYPKAPNVVDFKHANQGLF